MPHWIKSFVKAMESSGKKLRTRDVTFNGSKITFHTIQKEKKENK